MLSLIRISAVGYACSSKPSWFSAFLFLPLFAVEPPQALFNRKIRVLGLRDSGNKNVEATRIQPLPLETTELVVHPLRTTSPKFRYSANSEQLKIGEHCRTH